MPSKWELLILFPFQEERSGWDYRKLKDSTIGWAKSLKGLIMCQYFFGQNSKGAVAILVYLYKSSKSECVWRLHLWFHNKLESVMPQRNHFVKVMTAQMAGYDLSQHFPRYRDEEDIVLIVKNLWAQN